MGELQGYKQNNPIRIEQMFDELPEAQVTLNSWIRDRTTE